MPIHLKAEPVTSSGSASASGVGSDVGCLFMTTAPHSCRRYSVEALVFAPAGPSIHDYQYTGCRQGVASTATRIAIATSLLAVTVTVGIRLCLACG